MQNHLPNHPNGFTLVEALVALTITVVAGSALLLGIESTLQTTNDAVEQTIAQGLASQLMDEILGCRYMEYGCSPYDTVMTAGSAELAPGTRELFDDVDDFNNWSRRPPEDPWGVALGKEDLDGKARHPGFHIPQRYLDGWQREVRVSYIDVSNPAGVETSGLTTDYRAVEVRVYRNDPQRGRRELAKLRRVIAYVPPL